jgi:hypothetical protein
MSADICTLLPETLAGTRSPEEKQIWAATSHCGVSTNSLHSVLAHNSFIFGLICLAQYSQ